MLANIRQELKYIIPIHKLPQLREELSPYLVHDKFASKSPDNKYTVRSIYFDDKHLRYFYQKEFNHAERKKIRLRGYGNDADSKVVMEIKRKFSGAGIKNRGFLDYEKAIGKIIGGVESAANEDENMFLFHIIKYKLFPTVNVVYDREAYMQPVPGPNNLRITFDMNLRYLPMPQLDELFEVDRLIRLNPTNFILEIKFNDFYPKWLMDSVARLGVKRSPASKYSICLGNSMEMRTGMIKFLANKTVRSY